MGTNKSVSKDLAPLKFPKLHPETVVCDYLHSKTINNVIRKYPEWDVPRTDPAAELVVKKRELHGANTRLANKRQDAVQRRREIDELWKDLEDREEMLKSNFIKFNKFVKENQEKKERAERKIVEERAFILKRETEIENLSSKYDFMCRIRSKMEKNIRKHKLYENYLLAFTEMFPLFYNLDSILDRYEALAEARKVLADRQENDLSSLEEAKARMLRMTEENTLALMGLHNVMADLETRYESAKNKALHWETMVTSIKDTLAERLEDLQEIRQSAWTVYLAMCKRKEIEPKLAEHDVENQLLFIKSTIGELKKIIKIAQKRATKESSRQDRKSVV